VKDHTFIEPNMNSEEFRTVTVFGYELLREVLLPEILGKDTPEILYWAGKRIARKYPLKTFDEIVDFFSNASWGDLSLKNETKDELEFELISPLLVSRVKSKAEHFFQLEAGFLAEQIELQKEVVAETFEHPAKKSNKVRFTVKWDKKDSI
jgi:predicted hydrocarbon binding protein